LKGHFVGAKVGRTPRTVSPPSGKQQFKESVNAKTRLFEKYSFKYVVYKIVWMTVKAWSILFEA
jgi:hypothetical protein